MKHIALTFVITILIGLVAIFVGVTLYTSRSRQERNRTAAVRADVRILFREGHRREEYAALLAEKGICSADSFLVVSQGYEGTLFPDTYRFYADTPATEVVTKLRETYRTRTESLGTPTDAELIVASIVEREAQNDTERPLIAAVYLNRLRIGMKLDADPTVQYGKETLALNVFSGSLDQFTFWQPITATDYTTVRSPYNTYQTSGLPPGPIANPGIESIRAAMQPADHDYYYFFHRDGEIFLSRSIEEHRQKLQSR